MEKIVKEDVFFWKKLINTINSLPEMRAECHFLATFAMNLMQV